MAYEPWEHGKIPPSYHKITWEDRKERTARDYGPPERPYEGNFEGKELENLLAWGDEQIIY